MPLDKSPKTKNKKMAAKRDVNSTKAKLEALRVCWSSLRTSTATNEQALQSQKVLHTTTAKTGTVKGCNCTPTALSPEMLRDEAAKDGWELLEGAAVNHDYDVVRKLH